jgi:hypothetical protein
MIPSLVCSLSILCWAVCLAREPTPASVCFLLLLSPCLPQARAPRPLKSRATRAMCCFTVTTAQLSGVRHRASVRISPCPLQLPPLLRSPRVSPSSRSCRRCKPAPPPHTHTHDALLALLPVVLGAPWLPGYKIFFTGIQAPVTDLAPDPSSSSKHLVRNHVSRLSSPLCFTIVVCTD